MKRKSSNGALSVKKKSYSVRWVGSVPFWNLLCKTGPERSECLPSALGTALTGQNMSSIVLGILNFLTFFQKIFLLSAALSDSWCALILIIALHQYVFLSFFFLFFPFFGCSPLVWWSLFCLNHGYASAGNWLDLWVFEYHGILSWFACLQNKLVLCLFVESATGFSWNLPPS